MRTPHKLIAIFSITCACLAGCERQQAISSYQAPKEPARVARNAPEGLDMSDASATVMPVAMGQPAGREVPKWTLPDGWKPTGGDPMRFASIAAGSEEVIVSVIALPPQPLLPNVNRWEEQMGLPPSPEANLSKLVQHTEVDKIPAHVVDLTSPPATKDRPQGRMIVAIVPRGGQIWFFKIIGPVEGVAAQKANFDKFVQSISFNPAPAPASMPALPQAEGGMSLAGWKTPEGWQQLPVQPPRIATFLIGQPPKQGELVVQKWPAAIFADPLSNVNRWRAQVGLEALKDAKELTTQPVDIGGSKGSLYDMAGPQVRMLVGVLASGNEVWFFKFAGPVDLVAQQKAAFESFMKTVQFKESK